MKPNLIMLGVVTWVTVVWPLSPYAYMLTPWTWCALLGAVVLACSRFVGVRHILPGFELIFLAYPLLFRAASFLSGSITYDALLFSFDNQFFGPASYAVSKAFRAVPVVCSFIYLIYNAQALAMVVAYLALPDRSRKKFFGSVALAGVLAPLFYSLCPSAGPIFLASSFPDYIPDIQHPHGVPVAADWIILNAIPSLHVAWALLIFLHLFPVGRNAVRLSASYLVLTILSVLVTGEHYYIDVLLAFPFALGVFVLLYRRWLAGCGLLAFVGVFELALRFGAFLEIEPMRRLTLLELALITAMVLLGSLLVAKRTSAQPQPQQFNPCITEHGATPNGW